MDDLEVLIKQLVVRNLYLNIEPQQLIETDNLLAVYNLDSNMLVGVVLGLEQRFGIAVRDEEFNKDQFSTVNGIVEFVRSRKEDLEKRRPLVIAEITKAFSNVNRVGGISLHEADVIDGFGSVKEQSRARALDKENSWQEVPSSDIEDNCSILCFLDPIGFRYYIPALMVWTLNNYDKSDSFSVDSTIYAFLPHWFESASLERFQTLNAEQSKAVAMFLEYMSRATNCDALAARKALGHWRKIQENQNPGN